MCIPTIQYTRKTALKVTKLPVHGVYLSPIKNKAMAETKQEALLWQKIHNAPITKNITITKHPI